MSTGLLLIDIQNDYFPCGKMELVGSLEAAKAARRLLDAFREAGMPVIHVQHVASKPDAPFFLPDTPGVEIHELVRPLGSEPVVRKAWPNGFRDTFLLHHLLEADVERVVVAGMMTHMCVDATVRAATDQGFKCVVAHDACATRSLMLDGQEIPAEWVHRSFLAALQGAYGTVEATRDIIEQVEARAKIRLVG